MPGARPGFSYYLAFRYAVANCKHSRAKSETFAQRSGQTTGSKGVCSGMSMRHIGLLIIFESLNNAFVAAFILQ